MPYPFHSVVQKSASNSRHICTISIINFYTDMQFYSASFLGDMREVVSHVTSRYPEANIYAVGWSLGANILVRYLGQVR